MGYDIGIEEAFRRQEALHKLEESQYWQEVRVNAAIAAMQGITSSAYMMNIVKRNAEEADDYVKKSLSEMAVRFADALIEELKKEK